MIRDRRGKFTLGDDDDVLRQKLDGQEFFWNLNRTVFKKDFPFIILVKQKTLRLLI